MAGKPVANIWVQFWLRFAREASHTDLMRLVAVSVVKNEADIIESFIRHTLAWTDHHLVFDHDSRDGTREILGSLQREGLPITLFRDDSPGHLQQVRSNYLTRLAAQEYGADWVLPLDADEILTGPDRANLETCLQRAGSTRPASLPLHEYCLTTADDPAVLNPVQRLHHCRPEVSVTRKIFVSRALAVDPDLITGKGSHALYRGNEPLPATALPDEYRLAHLAQRSLPHQVLRLVRAELQRASRGRAAAGLDVHYRLGFQLLAENPDLFFRIATSSPTGLRVLPIDYRGGPLRYSVNHDWSRIARALLPYLDELAASHGRLADAVGFDVAAALPDGFSIHQVPCTDLPIRTLVGTSESFTGFTGVAGWSHLEGPVPEAFLPLFHWGYAPRTDLTINADRAGSVRLHAEVLTYSENQVVRIELNGLPLLQYAFTRVNQKETLAISLNLHAGVNQLTIHYSQCLVTEYDARKLAVIFLSLHIAPND